MRMKIVSAKNEILREEISLDLKEQKDENI